MGKGFLVAGIMWIRAWGRREPTQNVRCCQREGKCEEVRQEAGLESDSGRALWAWLFLEGVTEDKTSDNRRVRRCSGQPTRLVQKLFNEQV